MSVLCDVHNTLVNTIFRKYGSDFIKDKYLPMLSADKVRPCPGPTHRTILVSPTADIGATSAPQLGSFCLSETGSGSDAFALATTATKSSDGKHYTLNGSKCWITNSAEADIFLVFATQDPSKGYKGISCFVVEKKDGIEIAKKEKKVRAASERASERAVVCGADPRG